jgi:hypothetical protein
LSSWYPNRYFVSQLERRVVVCRLRPAEERSQQRAEDRSFPPIPPSSLGQFRRLARTDFF